MPLWIHGDAPTGVYVGDIRARGVYLGDVELWNGDVPVEIAGKTMRGYGSAPDPVLSAGFITELPAAYIGAGSMPVPDVVAGVGAVAPSMLGAGSAPTPTVTAAVTITPQTPTGVGSMPTPNVGEIVIAAPAASGAGSMPVPDVGGGVTIAAPALAGAGSAPAPSVGGGATITAPAATGAGSAPAPSTATPDYVASNSATALSGQSASLTLNYPAGSVAGQYVVAAVTFRRAASGAFTVATPAGWDLLATIDQSSSQWAITAIFGRIRGAETSVTITASTATSTYSIGQIHAFSGASKASQIATSFDLTTGTAITLPSVAHNVAPGRVLLMINSFNNTGTGTMTHVWTAPPVERLDTGAIWTAGSTYVAESAATDAVSAAGTYPAATVTTSATSNSHFCVAVVISPA